MGDVRNALNFKLEYIQTGDLGHLDTGGAENESVPLQARGAQRVPGS